MDVEEERRRATAKAALGKVSEKDLAESMRMIQEYAKPYCKLLRIEQGKHLRR